MDFATFIKFRVHKTTGAMEATGRVVQRPTWGAKELPRRRKAAKAARLARRKNR